jgi:hypothetical protein
LQEKITLFHTLLLEVEVEEKPSKAAGAAEVEL